jgi:hypothetical protein
MTGILLEKLSNSESAEGSLWLACLDELRIQVNMVGVLHHGGGKEALEEIGAGTFIRNVSIMAGGAITFRLHIVNYRMGIAFS